MSFCEKLCTSFSVCLHGERKLESWITWISLKALSAFVSQMLNIQHVFRMSFGFANRYLNRLFEMLWFISPEKTLMGENNFKVLFLSIIISIFQTLFFLYLTRM